MTDDRVEGNVKSGLGKAQSTIGGVLGNQDMESKGQVKEIAGKVQDLYGQATDKVKDATGNLSQMLDDEPYKALGIAVAAGVVVGFLLGHSGRKVVYVRG